MVTVMNASLLFALELHRARHVDLLRQAEELRLGRAAPARPREQPLPAAPCCRPAAQSA